MTTNLTPEQRQAIQQHGAMPLHLLDPENQETYVLLKLDVYEKLAKLFEDDSFDPREAYPFVDAVMQEDDANDPTLETYQKVQKP